MAGKLRSIRQALDEKPSGPQTERNTFVRVMQELTDGLAFLHKHGVMHRDVKPENVLLTADLHVRIADFGLSSKSAGLGFSKTLGIGSPAFMAPELFNQLGKRGQYDEEVDIYALAITLWSMYVGRMPALKSSMSPMQFLMMVNKGLRPAIPKRMPHGFARLIKKCWAVSPADRPKAAALSDDMRDAEELLGLPKFRSETDRASSASALAAGATCAGRANTHTYSADTDNFGLFTCVSTREEPEQAVAEIGAQITAGLRKLKESGQVRNTPAPALVLMFFTREGYHQEDFDYEKRMTKACAAWQGGTAGEAKGDGEVEAGGDESRAEEGGDASGDASLSWSPMVVGARSWTRAFCDVEGTPDHRIARFTTTAIVFADGIAEPVDGDDGGGGGSALPKGNGGGYYGVGVEELDEESDNPSHERYERAETQAKAVSALEKALHGFPEGVKPLALWVWARVGVEEVMLEGRQQALNERGWHGIEIAGGTAGAPGIVLGGGGGEGHFMERGFVVIALCPGGGDKGDEDGGRDHRYKVQPFYASCFKQADTQALTVDGVDNNPAYLPEHQKVGETRESKRKATGELSRGRQIKCFKLPPECVGCDKAQYEHCLLSDEAEGKGGLAAWRSIIGKLGDGCQVSGENKLALGRRAGEVRATMGAGGGGKDEMHTRCTYQVIWPTIPFSERHMEAHEELGEEEAYLATMAEVHDKDQLFVMKTSQKECDAFPAKGAKQVRDCLSHQRITRNQSAIGLGDEDETVGQGDFKVLGALFGYGIHCNLESATCRTTANSAQSAAVGSGVGRQGVNEQLRQALPADVPFLGQETASEQGIPPDETGHYQLAVSSGNSMLTMLVFVQQQQQQQQPS
eukprot:g2205.t1